MNTPRDELRELVEQLPDEQAHAVVSDLKAELTAVERQGTWSPSWFAVAEGSAADVSERVEEILTEVCVDVSRDPGSIPTPIAAAALPASDLRPAPPRLRGPVQRRSPEW